ncbi:hypothetical protein [Bacteroides acidifaciens]|uniref:hypothetical protein n=1 Tax=Bacteroides acidifaciens TaxID=85831 RepID=UPI00263B9E29|nr:hypothetical protein [Bacteroides acidifaciens]
MDRLEFLTSINQGDNTAVMILNYFDHIMAAYNIVSGCKKLLPLGNGVSAACFIMNIELSNANEAAFIDSKIKNELHNRIDIYGKIFTIKSSISDATLCMMIEQVQ